MAAADDRRPRGVTAARGPARGDRRALAIAAVLAARARTTVAARGRRRSRSAPRNARGLVHLHGTSALPIPAWQFCAVMTVLHETSKTRTLHSFLRRASAPLESLISGALGGVSKLTVFETDRYSASVRSRRRSMGWILQETAP